MRRDSINDVSDIARSDPEATAREHLPMSNGESASQTSPKIVLVFIIFIHIALLF